MSVAGYKLVVFVSQRGDSIYPLEPRATGLAAPVDEQVDEPRCAHALGASSLREFLVLLSGHLTQKRDFSSV